MLISASLLATIGTLEGAKAPSLRYVIHTGKENLPGMVKTAYMYNVRGPKHTSKYRHVEV